MNDRLNAAELAQVKAYHLRTQHQLQRYAAGPETLDWDAQPDPFRQWEGASQLDLPLLAEGLRCTWQDLFTPGAVPPQPVSARSVAALMELSLGLTAWKQYGPDRWALRANPSSGNLHPTEGYVLSRGVSGLGDGLHHYAPREHALLCRASAGVGAECGEVPARAGLWVGLSSIQWREAWKYGERAFRYCELDIGHALGAVRYAAAVLGWQARVVSGLTHADVAALLGLDRDADFGQAEREEPELMVAVGPALPAHPAAPQAWPASTIWHGKASRLDRHPMYRWPVIDEVTRASRGASLALPPGDEATTWADDGPVGSLSGSVGAHPPLPAARGGAAASALIRQRRSAQHFDKRGQMPLATFLRLLQAVMPSAGLPWDAWPASPRVHAVVYAHRVDGLAPGAYVLPRSAAGQDLLDACLQGGQTWQPVPEAPAGLPLQCLATHPTLSGTVRTLSCHQAIASDACFAVSLLAEFDGPLSAQPAAYRSLYQEAGLVGQVLYMQAEAEGYRGTGIGCYFDPAVHEWLGMRDDRLQVLYHFTVGVPVVDGRITTEPPYAHLDMTTRKDLP
jgi:SagB-type dehydrogenase family enzyme